MSRFHRFLHVEAASGVILLITAAAALIWANSRFADSYAALWHAPLGFQIGSLVVSQSLHFWINDGLMTLFFLVVGMEIRREIHEGTLRSPAQATLPLAAAFGGVVVPAAIYLALNSGPPGQTGWAVPTATDIAFAVGILSLLGRSVPAGARIFLLALAIIDDIIAVLIIALFYSGGLDPSGFAVAGLGVAMVLGLHAIGVGSALAYVVPGAILWGGLLMTGAHPTLAGVVLGLMTPVRSLPMAKRPTELALQAAAELRDRLAQSRDPHRLAQPLAWLRLARREALPPVLRVQMALHPWVAFGIMPLFALANAGVPLTGITFSAEGPQMITLGVALALVAGKPLGVIGASFVMVRMGWSRLPPGVSWWGIALVGLLAGIGFTMSIFIASLAFSDPTLLDAAKLGVLLGSVIAAVLGLLWGRLARRRLARG